MKSVLEFSKFKREKKKISMVTCYDFSFAKILDQSNIDCILVGDSLGMTMHGFQTTIPVTNSLMALHTRAVVAGAPNKFVIADLPFLTFRKSIGQTIEYTQELLQAGAHAVKLEGASGNIDHIHHIVESGVPVMGHLGMTPQSVNNFGGFTVQAKEKLAQEKLKNDALQLQKAGCFAVVLECVPEKLAQEVSEMLDIPTIGIGAGVRCDGQVLVLQDLLGMNNEFQPKFVKKYLDGFQQITTALNKFHQEVNEKQFPTEKETYL